MEQKIKNICNLKNAKKILLTFFYLNISVKFEDENVNYNLPEKHPPEKLNYNFTNDKSDRCVQTINNQLILHKTKKKKQQQKTKTQQIS